MSSNTDAVERCYPHVSLDRENAYLDGKPYKPAGCPKCGGDNIVEFRFPTPVGGSMTIMGGCNDCKIFWEAYPDDWIEDVAVAAMCDNCAFRGNSDERADKAGWEMLMHDLIDGGGEIFCHKGVPIKMTDKPDGGCVAEFDFPPDAQQQVGPGPSRRCAGYRAFVLKKKIQRMMAGDE